MMQKTLFVVLNMSSELGSQVDLDYIKSRDERRTRVFLGDVHENSSHSEFDFDKFPSEPSSSALRALC